MRNFIWSGCVAQRKLCTVSWTNICKPRAAGGLAVKDPSKVNQASLLFLTWKLLTSEEQWATICRTRFLFIGRAKTHSVTTSVWHGMKQHMDLITEQVVCSVGTGRSINFWNIPSSLLHPLNMKVSDCIVDGNWCIPDYILNRDIELAVKIHKVTLPATEIPDKLNSKSTPNGKLTNKIACDYLNVAGQTVPWSKLLWKTYIPPSRAFTTWRLIHNKLPTDENLRKRGCYIVSICCFCMKHFESSQHIFFECTTNHHLWNWLSKGTDQSLNYTKCLNIILGRVGVGSKMVQHVMNSAILHIIWCIWIERNQRCFHKKQQSITTLFNHVIVVVKLSYGLSLLKGASSMQDYKISNIF